MGMKSSEPNQFHQQTQCFSISSCRTTNQSAKSSCFNWVCQKSIMLCKQTKKKGRASMWKLVSPLTCRFNSTRLTRLECVWALHDILMCAAHACLCEIRRALRGPSRVEKVRRKSDWMTVWERERGSSSSLQICTRGLPASIDRHKHSGSGLTCWWRHRKEN